MNALQQSDNEIERLKRHVEDGRRHIARQREIIAELTRDGLGTYDARQLLAVFEQTQRLHEQHLEMALSER